MAKDSILRDKVLRNVETARQFQVKSLQARTFQKVTPEILYELLEDARGEVYQDAKRLLRTMSNMRWSIRSTAKEGGLGGRGRAPDPVLHITLRVGAQTYHLRARESLRQRGIHIYEITG